ncbi:alpha/beta hydrolase [Photobacterium atrarenae]|uniref:Lysophospholipase n=1 Tax=Photobacterium atrarenae TaxID=865757 RepID=A0ABY5GM10_9GAMM|nr:alpha/beta hydrolase [Photobacterium atrarenae]UTV29592.1 lysophospholipase [Photobacterium atrarenae]
MKRVFLLAMVGYMVFAMTFCSLQRKFLYFPQPASTQFGEENISFQLEDRVLQGWVVNPGQSRALLYYGGNAESIEMNIPFFRTVVPDYSVYLIPYRGYGNNPGQPTEQELYQDAMGVFRAVRENHSFIALMGRSLGSGVATFVAAERPAQVDRLLLVTPFDSVEHVAKSIYWMLPVSLLIKDRFASIERVSAIQAATFIFIAGQDRVIPHESAEQLVAAFGPQLKDVVVVQGADHNNIAQFPAYVEGVRRALDVPLNER